MKVCPSDFNRDPPKFVNCPENRVLLAGWATFARGYLEGKWLEAKNKAAGMCCRHRNSQMSYGAQRERQISDRSLG
jgi:hypothetical protein